MIKETKHQNAHLKCDTCGKFFSPKELNENSGGSTCFVPDSEVTIEENKEQCAECTKKYGRIQPEQTVFWW